jgi:rSAM/selenodomain-associated transferase 2
VTAANEPICVVVPTLNEARRIGALLEALTTMEFGEVIVADGGSSDDTVARARQIPGVQVISSLKGRGVQINAGVAAARSPIILVLHADTHPPADAPALVRTALAREGVSCGCFHLHFDSPSAMLSVYSWFARFDTTFTTFGDQAFFFRRSHFLEVGGAPQWTIMEDVELRSRLKSRGRLVKIDAPILTSARRFRRNGIIRQQLVNGILLAGYLLGVPIAVLALIYPPNRGSC